MLYDNNTQEYLIYNKEAGAMPQFYTDCSGNCHCSVSMFLSIEYGSFIVYSFPLS